MNQVATPDAYGVVTEPATLTIRRLLPGSVDRVWAYLTQSDLRRQWLAAGDMEMELGSSFELVWRNSELTDPPGKPPEGFGEEHRMAGEITELHPPYILGISWGSTGGVTFELEPMGDMVRLTIVHRRMPDHSTALNISAGWHAHLDVLAARLAGKEPEPFWNHWAALKAEYTQRLGA